MLEGFFPGEVLFAQQSDFQPTDWVLYSPAHLNLVRPYDFVLQRAVRSRLLRSALPYYRVSC